MAGRDSTGFYDGEFEPSQYDDSCASRHEDALNESDESSAILILAQ
jgi:hypothetical protein